MKYLRHQIRRQRRARWLAGALLFFSAFGAAAEPWIDTSNLALRNEIQLLADRGLIKAPVSTYPLMWAALVPDLEKIDPAVLGPAEQNAYAGVMSQLAFAKRNFGTVRLNVSNEDNRFASFGDDYRDKNSLLVSYAAHGERWAFKIAPSYVLDPDDDEKFRLDESYVATYLGNWVLALGAQDRWWAPGWDTNLSLTSNARPMPGVSISRMSSEPFRLIFTENFMIPWNVTTFMNWMGDDRTIEDALLWGFRLDFRLWNRLEIGVTRLAQWAGEGRPKGLDTFWDILLGKDNCGVNVDCGDNGGPSNQQAGIDARLSLSLFGQNVGLYGQFQAEDGSSDSFQATSKKRPMAGIDTTFMLGGVPVLTFFEFADSLEFCGDGRERGIGDCFYEHGTYLTGLRYNGRNIGNLYDNDAKSYVLGMVSQWHNDASWQWRLRYVELNRDNSDRYPGEPNGNTVTEIAEDLLMFSGRYERIFGRWKAAVGGSVSRSEFIDKAGENDYVAFVEIELLL